MQQSYAILQQALRNYARWVDTTSGVTVSSPGGAGRTGHGDPVLRPWRGVDWELLRVWAVEAHVVQRRDVR